MKTRRDHQAARCFQVLLSIQDEPRSLPALHRRLQALGEQVSLRTLERYSKDQRWTDLLEEEALQDQRFVQEHSEAQRQARRADQLQSRLTAEERAAEALVAAVPQLCGVCSDAILRQPRELHLCPSCSRRLLPMLTILIQADPPLNAPAPQADQASMTSPSMGAREQHPPLSATEQLRRQQQAMYGAPDPSRRPARPKANRREP